MTGGAGFIGRHLVRRLLERGDEVTGIDDLSSGPPPEFPVSPRLHLRYGAGLREPARAAGDFEGVDTVYHLAGRGNLVGGVNDPYRYFADNVATTAVVVEAMRRSGTPTLVYAASSSCYGATPAFPVAEDAPLAPSHPYAVTKQLGEAWALACARGGRLRVISARLFNVIGPEMRRSGAWEGILPTWLGQLERGEPLTLVGDGTQVRDFVDVEDVVQALLLLGERACGGSTWNVGSGIGTSITALADALAGPQYPRVPLPWRVGEPRRIVADITRLTRLGWAPRVGLGTSLARLRLEAGSEAADWAGATTAWNQAMAWIAG